MLRDAMHHDDTRGRETRSIFSNQGTATRKAYPLWTFALEDGGPRA